MAAAAPDDCAEEYTITPKFYTSKNWFKYVQLGMKRCRVKTESQGLLVSAFASKDGKRRVVVVVNPNKEKRQRLRFVTPPSRVYRTSKTKNCLPIKLAKSIPLVAPTQSVTTFIWSAVQED